MATQFLELEFDGIIIPNSDYNVANLVITNEVGIEADFASEVTFYGATAGLMKSIFIDDPNGRVLRKDFKVYDRCCGTRKLAFFGTIEGDMISWCEGDCEIKVNPISRDTTTEQRRCFRDTLIYNTSLIKNKRHIHVPYCMEVRPNFIHDVLIILAALCAMFINALLIAIQIIAIFIVIQVAVITLLAMAISLGRVKSKFKYLEDVVNLLPNMKKSLRKFIYPCYHKHPSPLVRDYIQGLCDKCGITTFQSTILNSPSSPYYNMVMLTAEMKKGTEGNVPKGLWSGNEPIKTGEQLLKDLVEVFNAEYDIRDSKLIFEQRDWFLAGPTKNVPFKDIRGNIRGSWCYQFSEEPPKASMLLKYSDDFVDAVGNESKWVWYYDRIEWNPLNASPVKKGIWEQTIPFGMHRQRNDGIERDVIQTWAWLLSLILLTRVNKTRNWLILERGLCSAPKLLVVDNNGVPINKNYDMHVKTLYERFWYKEEQRNNVRRFDVSIETDTLSCTEFQELEFSVGKTVALPIGGVGRIKKTEVDYIERKVKLTVDF